MTPGLFDKARKTATFVHPFLYICIHHMKNLISTLAVILLSISLSAQGLDVKDYFYRIYYSYPDGGYFDASRDACFFSYILKGTMEEYEYWGLNEGRYTLTWKYQVREGSGHQWNTISMAEHVLDYKVDCVYSTYQTYYNMFAPKGNYQHDKITLLALPLATGPRTWKETVTGDKYNCSAEWTYLTNDQSFYEPAIKVKKTMVSSGITEISYWARYYGKVWVTWAEKGKDPFTVKQRHGLGIIREISQKSFNEETAKRAFLKEHKDEMHSLEKDSPKAWSALKDAYDKYLVGQYRNDFLYYYGPNLTSRSAEDFIKDDKYWRDFSMKFHTAVNISDFGIKCIDPTITKIVNGHETGFKMFFRRDNWAEPVLKKLGDEGLYERSSAVEPVSGYRLYFNMVDTFEQTIALSAFKLTVKRKKGEFQLTDGDADIWSTCSEALLPHLEAKYAKAGKSKMVVRLVRFAVGQHVRFALVTDCFVSRDNDYCLECKLADLSTE